jgi:lipopolysaccharide export system permease protein
MIALAGVLVGEFSRRGYGRRIMWASIIALLVRLIALAVQAAAVENPELNPIQYALPVVVMAFAGVAMGGKSSRRKRLAEGPSVLAEA